METLRRLRALGLTLRPEEGGARLRVSGLDRLPADQAAWARRCLSRKVTSGEGDDAPALTPERREDLLAPQSVSEAKAAEQTALLAVQRKKSEMEYARLRGRLTETATVQDELAARAQAFRRGLERFGMEEAEAVAADFGASFRGAADLAARLGFEGEAAARAAVTIQNFVLSRAQIFSARWADRIEAFLDPYATGAWWTPAMREAWDRYERGLEHDNGETGGPARTFEEAPHGNHGAD